MSTRGGGSPSLTNVTPSVATYAALPTGVASGTIQYVENASGSYLTFNKKKRGFYRFDGTSWYYAGDNSRLPQEIPFDNASTDVSATNVQDAISEMDSENPFYIQYSYNGFTRYKLKDSIRVSDKPVSNEWSFYASPSTKVNPPGYPAGTYLWNTGRIKFYGGEFRDLGALSFYDKSVYGDLTDPFPTLFNPQLFSRGTYFTQTHKNNIEVIKEGKVISLAQDGTNLDVRFVIWSGSQIGPVSYQYSPHGNFANFPYDPTDPRALFQINADNGTSCYINTPVTKIKGIVYNYVSTAVDYTANQPDKIIGCTIGGITITLPSNAVAGKTYIIKDQSGSAGSSTITIATEGSEMIDGSGVYLMNTNYEKLEVYFDGTNYFII